MPGTLAKYIEKRMRPASSYKETLTLISKKEGRPDVHFIDVGTAFMDPKIQRRREKAAAHRAAQRQKKQQQRSRISARA